MFKKRYFIIILIIFFLSGCNIYNLITTTTNNDILGEDTTSPAFSNVPSLQTIEYGTDLDLLSLGLTARDNVDGDITSRIRVNINTTTSLPLGEHTITYKVSDTVGNEETLNITLIVVDTTKPVFYYVPTELTIMYGTDLDLLNLGITARDNVDGDITSRISVNIADTTTLPVGEHTATFTVSDTIGNEEIVNITIIVEDTTKPVFSNVPTNQTIEYGTNLDLLSLGLTARDNVDGDITSLITVNINDTTSLPVGEHTVTYTVTDSERNEETINITLIVEDTTKPIFSSLPTKLTIEYGTDIDLLGLHLTASDNVDGDITSRIKVNISDTTILPVGEHTVTFTVSDTVGNEETINITLIVEDKTKPIFSNVPTNQLIEYGTDLDLLSLGLTASDDIDGDITSRITVNINDTTTLTVGKYTVTYTALDTSGNEAIVKIYLYISTDSSYFTVNSAGDTITNYDKSGGEYVVIPGYINGNLITKIGNSAFSSLSLIEVIIPDSVTTIGTCAFCSNYLFSVTIPDSVTTIGDAAFHDNILDYVDLGNGVTTIGTNAFALNWIKNLTIPASVTYLNGSSFSFYNMDKINISEDNPSYKIINNFIMSKDNQTIVALIGSHESIVIPDYITTIGDFAFYKNRLKSVTIPDSVITIGVAGFSNNLSLTNLTLGKNVTTIGSDAFESNDLSNIIIPNSVTTIGDGAFSFNLIKNLTIPNSVTIIGDFAFYSNDMLSLIIGSSVTTIGNNAFAWNKLTSVTIPDSVTTIDYGAFYANSLTSIKLGNGVKTIGDTSFQWNLINSVTIPNSVTTIGDYAFCGNRLTNVNIGNRVSIIGEGAFATNHLTKVTIPDNVTFIGGNSFDFSGLTTLNISSNHPKYKLKNNFLLTKDNLTLIALIGWRTSVTIPDGVVTIGNYALYENDLTSVSIPNTVKTIGNYAFYGNRLTSVTIPNSVTTIGRNGFDFRGLTTLNINNNHPKYKLQCNFLLTKDTLTLVAIIGSHSSVTIPNNVKAIGDFAFYNYELTNVTIPSSVTTIGDFAFYESGLPNVTIPNSVTTIGDYAFYRNKLVNVTIPSSVKTIGDYAFAGNPIKNLIIEGDSSRFRDRWSVIGFPSP